MYVFWLNRREKKYGRFTKTVLKNILTVLKKPSVIRNSGRLFLNHLSTYRRFQKNRMEFSNSGRFFLKPSILFIDSLKKTVPNF
jgi:hypothetical protein